jgi:hypothetical protein
VGRTLCTHSSQYTVHDRDLNSSNDKIETE